MKLVVFVLSALITTVFADSGNAFKASLFPSGPVKINNKFPGLRVVNGLDAWRNEVPYQISLQKRANVSFSHICGGSIIAPRWILTAAQCLQNGNAFNYRVVAGILLLSDQNIPGQQTVDVEQLIVHPNYPGGVSSNDIGLVRLAWRLFYANNVRAIGIPPAFASYEGDATLSGWGLTRNGGFIPNNLQVATVPIIPAQECSQYFNSRLGSNSTFDVTLNICSGMKFDVQSVSTGDGGGPLASNGRVIGIVSWGILPWGDGPSVYTRTSACTNWIVQQTYGEVQPR